jgi:nitrogen fixation protein NifU and related proteins
MEDILREILLDHVKNPKNKKELDNPDLSGHSNNPVCGDVVKVDLHIENDTVIDVAVNGQGCAVSQASMSIFGEEIKGVTTEDIKKKINEFKSLLGTNEVTEFTTLSEEAKVLKFLEGNPSKIRCALLSWSAIEKVIK